MADAKRSAKKPAKKPAAKKPSAKKTTAKKPVAKKRAPVAARRSRLVPAVLTIATLAVGVGLAAIPVGNWMEQRDELDSSRERRAELEAEILEIEADIENLVGEEGLEIAARCYGPYVEVGEEVYAVPGLNGCVTHPTSIGP